MHNSHPRKALAAAVLALVCGAGTAQAVDEVATYTLNDVTFADGATATGSFAFDLTTDKLSSWSISVTGAILGSPPNSIIVPGKLFFSTTVGSVATYPFSFGTPAVPAPTLGFTIYSTAAQDNWLTLGFGTSPTFGLAGAPMSLLLTSGGERLKLSSGSTFATSLNVDGEASVIRTGLVGAVPEPSSVALMLAGLVVVGATLRRRAAT